MSTTQNKMYGNKDSKKLFEFSVADADKLYIVRHFSKVVMPSGATVEDPGSSRIQAYDVDTFEAMSKQKVEAGSMKMSQFDKMGLGVEILHDPVEHKKGSEKTSKPSNKKAEAEN